VSLSELREEHLSPINVLKSFNVQPGFINNFVPYNTVYMTYFMKYISLKTSFHGTLLCVALFTLLVLF
jgi:hypothetical protein